MLVSEYLARVYEEIDKEGMPYFERDDILRRMVTATYSFLEEATPYIEANQKIREDLNNLISRFNISYGDTIADTTDAERIYPINVNDFYRLVSLKGIVNGYNRAIKIVQANDYQKLLNDPFNEPSWEEPLGTFANNSFKIKPSISNVIGTYLKHPVFGSEDNDELIDGLPVQIQLFLIQKVVLHLMTTIGDERFQMQYYQVGKKNTDS